MRQKSECEGRPRSGVGPWKESTDDRCLHIEGRHRSWPIDKPNAMWEGFSSHNCSKTLLAKQSLLQNHLSLIRRRQDNRLNAELDSTTSASFPRI
jgi:hypothetical protein